MDDDEADYDSYSDWEAYAGIDPPPPGSLKSLPLKFVLVDDEKIAEDDSPRDVLYQETANPSHCVNAIQDTTLRSKEVRGDKKGGSGFHDDGSRVLVAQNVAAHCTDSPNRREATSAGTHDTNERIPRHSQRRFGQERKTEKSQKRPRPLDYVPFVSSDTRSSPKQRFRTSKGRDFTRSTGRFLNPVTQTTDLTGGTQGPAPSISTNHVQAAKNTALRKRVPKPASPDNGKFSDHAPTGMRPSQIAPPHLRSEKQTSTSSGVDHLSAGLPTSVRWKQNEGRQHEKSLHNTPVPLPAVMGTSVLGISQLSLPAQEMDGATSTPSSIREAIASSNNQHGGMFGLQPDGTILHGFQRPLSTPRIPTPRHPGALYSNPISKSNPLCDVTSPALFHGGMPTTAFGPFPFQHAIGYPGVPNGLHNFAPPLPIMPGRPFIGNFGSDMMQAVNFQPPCVGNPGQVPPGAFPNERVDTLRGTIPVDVPSQPLNTEVIAPRSNVLHSPVQALEVESNLRVTDKSLDREDVREDARNAEVRSNDCAQMTGASAQRSKNTPVKGTTVRRGLRKAIEVDEIPYEEDDDAEDHVSRLNEIPQKRKFIALARPQWQMVRVRSGGGSGWMCTMKATVLRKSPQEVVECVSVARNKNRAKRAAAKEMLLKLKSKLPEAFLSENQGKQTNQPVRMHSAVNALHQLAQEGNLPCQPGYDVEEVNEAGENHWRCTTTLFTRDHDSKVFVEYGPSKNAAKQKGARKALEAIIKLKSPGADQFQKLLLPAEIQPTKTMANIPGASEVIFQTGDDEMSHGSCDDLVEGTGLRLELPTDYELVIAETESDCLNWFSAHAQPGARLGIYIDSETARDSVFRVSELEGNKEYEIKFPMLCFSSANAGIVVRVDKRESSPDAGGLSQVEENTFWVPDIVADTLEDARVEKAALACDEGLDELFERHGIQADGVQDVALTSIAIAGLGRFDGRRQFSSLRQLTKYWMRQEVKDINWQTLWPKRSELPKALLGTDAKELAAAVLSAFAVRCVRVKLSDAARMKRVNMGGASNDLVVLCKRVLDSGTS